MLGHHRRLRARITPRQDTLSLAAPTQPLEPAAPLKCCSCEPMVSSAQLRVLATLLISLLPQGCARRDLRSSIQRTVPANTQPTKTLAVYEPWFGHPAHINVGYSSQDPLVIQRQIEEAKKMGISGFVVDWYGEREPFLDKAYALVQSIAARQNFNVAMMFDESDLPTEAATDDALAAFEIFKEKYLAASAKGRSGYLEYEGRPVIFIFPKGGHTDWNRVRSETDHWSPPPVLIHEFAPGPSDRAFDGFYAWVNPGKKGWAPDGSNWGEDYLRDFYQTMQTRYPDKIAVGAAWAGFDDRKASWSLGRYMSPRCGATFADTMSLPQKYYPAEHPLPFLLVATWNDYEESSAIERGLAKCKGNIESSGQ